MPSAAQSLYLTAQNLLSQCIDLLQETVTTDEQLSFTSKLIPGSTIGKHLRHTHDHLRLLLDSLAASKDSPDAPLALSYDTRSRNVTSETSQAAALASFEDLRNRLEVETDKGRKVDSARRIKLEAVTPMAVEMESSWARELWFTALHGTHHLALLRVIVVGELGLEVPEGFGVAPSTATFRAWEQESKGAAGSSSAASSNKEMDQPAPVKL